MATVIVDRRNEPNRNKYGKDIAHLIRRLDSYIKENIQNNITSGSVADIGKGGIKIPVPKKLTRLPVLHHRDSEDFSRVFPGNCYDVGDEVVVPPGGGGGRGNEGDPDAEDENDDFIWLDEDTYFDLLFEGRSLPDMIKLHQELQQMVQRERVGHTSNGPTHKMDMRKTNKKRKKDSILLNKASERRLFQNLSEQYNIYRSYNDALPEMDLNGKTLVERDELVSETHASLTEIFEMSSAHGHKNTTLTDLFNCVQTLEDNMSELVDNPDHVERLSFLKGLVPEQLKAGRDADKFQSKHKTYFLDKDQPKPTAKAVMICKMDVSGSMSQGHKNIAKVFFSIVNRFLESNYDETEIVWLTHTTTPEEVDEEEFFYGTRSGGTLVSPCLDKELEIIQERYPVDEWNIYSIHASDGDNWGEDNIKCKAQLENILPLQQASYYLEIYDPNSPWAMWRADEPSELQKMYEDVSGTFPQLHIGRATSAREALEAFEAFFPRGNAPAATPKLGV